MSRLAFVDCETVTLELGPDVIWEIGVITRDDGQPDREWSFQLRPNMAKANDDSLRISRFHERYALTGKRVQALGWSPLNGREPAKLTRAAVALQLSALLAGRSVFGICPSFDTLRLEFFLRREFGAGPGFQPPWHYQPHDVEDEVAGFLRRDFLASPSNARDVRMFDIPRPTEVLAHAMGVTLKAEDEHTALGDARFARDLYDAVQNGGPF